MKPLRLTVISLACAALIFTGCQSKSGGNSGGSGMALTTNPDSLRTTRDSVSYVLGKNMHQNFQRQGIDINEKLVAQALMDAINGQDTLISEAEAKPIMRQFQQKMMKKRRQQMQKQRQQKGPGGQPNGQDSDGQSRKEQLKKRLKEKMEKQQQKQQSEGGN